MSVTEAIIKRDECANKLAECKHKLQTLEDNLTIARDNEDYLQAAKLKKLELP